MSDVKSLLEQLKEQHANFIVQRDQLKSSFNQLEGAVAACEIMIKKHEDEIAKESTEENSGDQENGHADQQETLEPTQE